jgi:hypothetical protein
MNSFIPTTIEPQSGLCMNCGNVCNKCQEREKVAVNPNDEDRVRAEMLQCLIDFDEKKEAEQDVLTSMHAESAVLQVKTQDCANGCGRSFFNAHDQWEHENNDCWRRKVICSGAVDFHCTWSGTFDQLTKHERGCAFAKCHELKRTKEKLKKTRIMLRKIAILFDAHGVNFYLPDFEFPVKLCGVSIAEESIYYKTTKANRNTKALTPIRESLPIDKFIQFVKRARNARLQHC